MKDVAALMAKRFTVSQVIHYDGAMLPSGEVPRVGIPKHEVLSCTIFLIVQSFSVHRHSLRRILFLGISLKARRAEELAR